MENKRAKYIIMENKRAKSQNVSTNNFELLIFEVEQEISMILENWLKQRELPNFKWS